MNIKNNIIKNSKPFKHVSPQQWNVFNEGHKALYGGNYRNLNIKDGEERLFLTTAKKREDGLINLVAVKITDTTSGRVRFTIREDIESAFIEFYKSIE